MTATAALKKQVHALIGLYIQLYRSRYDSDPTINRYREQWGFQSMVEDLGYERAKQVIQYYFSTGRVGHPLMFLLYNYDKLNVTMTEIAEDEKKRAELRARTAEKVKEWESARGDE